MERVDNLTCEGCLHLQIKTYTKLEPRHCAYCLRTHGETRIWKPGSRELLMHLTDCYMNLTEISLPTLTTPPADINHSRRPRRKERPTLG